MAVERAELGARYRDTVSGFAGTADARTEYLYSTPQVRLTAETGQGDGKQRWIEEGALEPAPDGKQAGFGGP